MATTLKDQQANMLREHFKAFDKDGNGLISPSELKQAMSDMGQELSSAEIDEMIKKVDIDGDGHLNYNEFIKLMTG